MRRQRNVRNGSKADLSDDLDEALAQKLRTDAPLRGPSYLCLDEALPVELDAHTLANVEGASCRHFASFETHVDEAYSYDAVIAAVNDRLDVEVEELVTPDPSFSRHRATP